MPFDINSIDHEFFMREALAESELAMQAGERPIGAVIVHHGQIIGRGRAEHQGTRNRLAHAELNALLASAHILYDHPHSDRIIYTTVEFCEMCLGAIVMSDAINHIVYSIADDWVKPKQMLEMPHVKRHIHSYLGGILEEESIALFQQSRLDELRIIQGQHSS